MYFSASIEDKKNKLNRATPSRAKTIFLNNWFLFTRLSYFMRNAQLEYYQAALIVKLCNVVSELSFSL